MALSQGLPIPPKLKAFATIIYSPLSQMLDLNDPLIASADVIDWKIFDDNFIKFYSKEGRPAKPIGLMLGILLLKHLNLEYDTFLLWLNVYNSTLLLLFCD